MDLKPSRPPIHIGIRPSRTLALVVLGIHAATLVVIAPLELPLPAKALLSVAVIASLVQNLYQYVFLRSPRSIVQMVWETDGEWMLMQRNGQVFAALLLPSSFVHHRMLVLNFRLRSRHRRPAVVLFDDAVGRSTLRRLRVRLRTDLG